VTREELLRSVDPEVTGLGPAALLQQAIFGFVNTHTHINMRRCTHPLARAHTTHTRSLTATRTHAYHTHAHIDRERETAGGEADDLILIHKP
jgi:hypothetical protein